MWDEIEGVPSGAEPIGNLIGNRLGLRSSQTCPRLFIGAGEARLIAVSNCKSAGPANRFALLYPLHPSI